MARPLGYAAWKTHIVSVWPWNSDTVALDPICDAPGPDTPTDPTVDQLVIAITSWDALGRFYGPACPRCARIAGRAAGA